MGELKKKSKIVDFDSSKVQLCMKLYIVFIY